MASAYLTAVLADTPVHYWRLGDLGGAIAADIGSSPLPLFGFGATQAGYSGPVSDGGSWYFNAGPFLRSFPTIAANVPFTLECWVYFSQSGSDQLAFAATSNLGIRSDQTPLCTSPGSALTTATPVLSINHWHQIAATFTSSGRSLYADGALAIVDAHAVANSTPQIFIGENGSGAGFFAGFIAEAAYYAPAITTARIAAHFAAADAVGSQPAFQAAAGTFPGTSDSVTLITATLQSVLDFVAKLYQNAP